MDTQQFPPSSPLIGEDHDVVLNAKYAKAPSSEPTSHTAGDELPTPNPSSSLGDVANSSVVISESTATKRKLPQSQSTTQIESLSKKRVYGDHSFQNILTVPMNGDEVKVGRSSMSSNFTLNSKNKAVSRLHLTVKYLANENMVELHCIGYNGVNITIPALTNVHTLDNHRFLVSVKDREPHSLPVDNTRVLDRSKDLTNFYMLRYETILMPLIEGTFLDVRGEIVLLQYPEESELKRDEIRRRQVDLSSEDFEDANRTMDDDIEISVNSDSPKPIDRKDTANSYVFKELTPEASFIHSTPIVTPLADKTFVVNEEIESLPAVEREISAEPQQTPTEQKQSIPATEDVDAAEETAPVAELATPSVKPLLNITNIRKEQTKRGRPSGKKSAAPKKKKLTEEEQIKTMDAAEVEATLADIESVEDLANVITNHISYSRILQTPFHSIRELASVKAKNLTRLQLRCLIYHRIACIGVIYREGKDAAGKPLDEEYYYIPEKDDDKDRVRLVEDLKGSSSHLRSCRKTHKQYFWKKPK